jgi:hypothetical protein
MPLVALFKPIPSSACPIVFWQQRLPNSAKWRRLKPQQMQVMALQPSFTSHEFCAAVGVVPALAKSLTEAWRQAGLPP